MSTDPNKKITLEWMYEGPSSSINREDYLVGKKIDKTFERHSDFQEAPSKLDRVIQNKTIQIPSKQPTTNSRSGGVTSSLLDLDTIKKEDPLVAMKVRKEKMKQEILENPMKMKRLQKIVFKSMEKKMMKMMEKQKRRRGNDSSSEDDDSSSESEDDRRRSSRRKSPSSERNDNQSSRNDNQSRSDRRDYRRRDSGERNDYRQRNKKDSEEKYTRRRNSRSRSPRRDDSRSHRKISPSPKSHDQRRPNRRSREEKSPIPSTRKRHDSNSSSTSNRLNGSEKNEKYSGYGLIHIKKPATESESTKNQRSSPKREIIKPTIPKLESKPKKWTPLSEEEMERKRLEMMDNAKWRDEQRKKNLKRHANREEEQKKNDTKQSGEAVDFIRKMVSSSTNDETVEGRVKSKVQRIQRSAASMDTNFVRK